MKVPQEVIDLRSKVLNGEEISLEDLKDTVTKLAEMRGGALSKVKAAQAPIDVMSLFDGPEKEEVKVEKKKDGEVW